MISGEQKFSVKDNYSDIDRVVFRLCFIVDESVGNGVLDFDFWSRLVHPCGTIIAKRHALAFNVEHGAFMTSNAKPYSHSTSAL